MSYTIDIIDTTSNNVFLELKNAGAKSLLLSWNGADDKLPRIVSSSFKFTMVDDENQDGRYDVLYTGNETKYKLNIIHDASQTIIWQGFMLPDLYNEPYTNNVVMVDFEATDGLGRLKGKYLADDFYSDEKSIIQIISACLRATGLNLDLFFAPAIESTINKDYNTIYIDTANYINGTKKQDAYTILNTLVEDMLCVLYQADNRWYFEGVNRRQIRVIDYKYYDANGNFISIAQHTKLLKQHNAVVTPQITTVSPYGSINVSQKTSVIKLPETIQQEKNDGWAVPPGTNGRILATDWIGYGGFDAFAEAYDYTVQLETNFGKLFTDIDFERFIRLREKIYVQSGDKYHFAIAIDLLIYNTVDLGNTIDSLAGTIIEISIGGELVKNIQFEFLIDEKSKTVEFDFVVQESGLLDLKIYEPFLSLNQYYSLGLVSRFVFKKLELKKLNDTEDVYIENSVNDEFTLVHAVDLTYSDDASGFGTAFRLSKLKTSLTYIVKEVTVKYPINFLGENYLVVDLLSANLIADNITSVYHEGLRLDNLEVIYNFNKGEEMVVKTANAIAAGEILQVFIYSKNEVYGDRLYWQQWTDAIYQIETNRYAQVVADIYRRMHSVAHYKVDMTLKQSVKYNDIISFPYKLDQNYILTNCTWDLDSNHTTVTAIKGYYLNSVVTNPTDNISPIVNAGLDITLPIATTNTTLLAIASDPDGFIVSYLWEQISGDATAVIYSPTEASTLVSNLTGSGDYVFMVTVTDNEGATATDTVTIRKNVSYAIDITEDCVSDVATPFGSTLISTTYSRRKVLGIAITPALPVGTSVTLTFKLTTFEIARNSIANYDENLVLTPCATPSPLPPLWIPGTRGRDVLNPDGYNSGIGFAIMKNGALIYGAANGVYTNPNTIEVSILSTSDVFLIIDHFMRIYVDSYFQSFAGTNTNRKIELINAVVTTGAGTLTGFPETIYAYNDYSPALITPSIVSFTIATTSVTLSLLDYNSASPETINIYIEYCENDGDDLWVVHGNTPRASTSYIVTGLLTSTDYKIRCKSVVTLETFESEYSNIITARTL